MAACRCSLTSRNYRKRAGIAAMLLFTVSLLARYPPAAVKGITNHPVVLNFHRSLLNLDTGPTTLSEKQSARNSTVTDEAVYKSANGSKDDDIAEEVKEIETAEEQQMPEDEGESEGELEVGQLTKEEEQELDADTDEEELEALAHGSSDRKYVQNSGLVKYYNHPLLTLCQLVPKAKDIQAVESANHSLTLEECRSKCFSSETSYALLSRGRCTCSNSNEPKQILNLESCDIACDHENETCNLANKSHGIIMRAGVYDGGAEWTTWMQLQQIHTKVRYRGCHRNKSQDTECQPDFERTLIHKTPMDPVSKYLIGCFTGYTIAADSNLVKQSTEVKYYNSHTTCRNFCISAGTSYAYLGLFGKKDKKRCLCTDTLARSQPMNSCIGPGYSVLWTKNTPVVLKFTGEARKAGKVLVLARYRSGSSMTQSFFIKNPNLFALFEPGKLKVRPWQLPPEETDRALLTALEAVFSCNLHKVHPSFHNSPFLSWSSNMLTTRGQTQNHMGKVLGCMQATSKVNCGPHWLEACQMSEFINIKVIRVFSVASVREFIERNPDVHVVHLVRDPRALLSAQKKFGAKPPDAYLCNQMVEVGKMIQEMKERGSKNAHEVFYEQLAVNSSFYGAKIYKEMGLEMPSAVAEFLSRDNLDPHKPIPRNVAQVVMKSPIAHVYGYIQRFHIDRIIEIDSNCQNLYQFWPSHYTNFTTFYGKYQTDIESYLTLQKKKQLQDYFT